MYDEANGFLRGTGKTIWTIMTKSFWFYTYMVYIYDETIRLLAPARLGKFLSTGGKGGNILRITDWRDSYVFTYFAIQRGAFWSFVLFLFTGAHIYLLILWLPLLLMPVAAVIAPFIFNPAFTGRNRWLNVSDAIKAWVWGLADTMAKIEYLNPLTRWEEDRIQRLVILAQKLPSATGADSCIATELALFQQYPGHYRSCLLYTSPSPRDGLLSRMPSSA